MQKTLAAKGVTTVDVGARRWATNSKAIAEKLQHLCADDLDATRLQSAGLCGMRQELVRSPVLGPLEAGPHLDEPDVWATHPQYYAQIYDTTSGVQLDPVLVAQARREEMQFLLEKMQTWDYDTVENCVRHTGAQPIPMVWVDVNKGDEMRSKVRSRLCVAETRGRTSLDLADPSQTFSATPPIEALRLLVSMTMSPRSTAEGHHVLMFVDIARAHPHCTMNSDL